MNRPVVSMPVANIFNEILSMDLKIWDDRLEFYIDFMASTQLVSSSVCVCTK